MTFLYFLGLSSILPGLLIRIPVGGAGILLSDLLLPLIALLWILHKIIARKKFAPPYFLASGFIFLLIAFLSFLWGSQDLFLKEKLISFSYTLRFLSILIFGWMTYEFINKNPQFYQKFSTIFWVITAGILAFGYLQFYLIPDISKFSTVGGFDPHMGRFLGTWMDPNFVAGFLAFVSPILIAEIVGLLSLQNRPLSHSPLSNQELLSEGRTSRFDFTLIFRIVVLGGILLADFLTFSRSGYLAMGVALGMFLLFWRPKILLLAMIIAVIGIASNERALQRVGDLAGTIKSIVLRDTDEVDATANLRLESWGKSLELFEKYPIFGIGYNTYRYRASEEGIVDESFFSAGGSDSTLLTILVTTGIFGLLSFLYFFGQIWFRHFFSFYKNPTDLFSLAICSGSAGIFIHSFFVNSWIFPHIFLPIMCWVGIGAYLIRRK